MKTFNNPVFAYNDSPLMIYQFEVFSHHLTGSPTVYSSTVHIASAPVA